MPNSQPQKIDLKLPIDDILEKLLEAVKSCSTTILRASPGAGKTTRVPPALTKICERKILVLEPRRLAARLSAERIASELDENVGDSIGYHIRFEQKQSQNTKVLFVTEGMFLRYLRADPDLLGFDCIVLDEFHERNLHTDVALALTRHLQKNRRPDLKLVIMSATLDTTELSSHFPHAAVLTSEVRQHPITTFYQPLKDKSLEEGVYIAVEKLLTNPDCKGHILVFLPGQKQIQSCFKLLNDLKQSFNCEILTLYGNQSSNEQKKVFADLGVQKIILSTNVAETSLTIPGVTGVIDSCLAKTSGFASWSGMPTLDLKKISQASAIQRSGRAGRTSAGVAIRLIGENEFQSLALFEKPEICRSDLTHIIMDMAALAEHINQEQLLEKLDWLTLPDEKNVASCLSILRWIGAFDNDNQLTDHGRRIAAIQLHPRLACLVVRGIEKGEGMAAIVLAALLSEGVQFVQQSSHKENHFSDYENCIDWFFDFQPLENLHLNLAPPVKRALELIRQLVKQTKCPLSSNEKHLRENSLALACMSAFPDRVAQKRKNSSNSQHSATQYVMCLGRGALLSRRSCLTSADYILVLDGEEMATSQNGSQAISILKAIAIEPEYLLSANEDFLFERRQTNWDAVSQRVRSTLQLCYGNLVIEESQLKSNEEQEQILKKTIKAAWPKPFENDSALTSYHIRIDLLKKHGINLNFPNFENDGFERFLDFICKGKSSFSEVLSDTLENYIAQQLTHDLLQTLQKWVPTHIKIGAGRNTPIHYDNDKPPWIASRMQDFFGSLATPKILQGQLSLVVHLLAPNMRAVQVTKDLESFWATAYPRVQKELSRRYPRHFWPEDPRQAEPPPLKKR